MLNPIESAVADLAITRGVVDPVIAWQTIEKARITGSDPVIDLITGGHIDANTVMTAAAEAGGYRAVDLSVPDQTLGLDGEFIDTIGIDYLNGCGVLPVIVAGKPALVVANPRTPEIAGLQRNERYGGLPPEILVGRFHHIAMRLERASTLMVDDDAAHDPSVSVEDLLSSQNDTGSETLRWFDEVRSKAVELDASDIHLEFTERARGETDCLPRLRIHGSLVNLKMPASLKGRGNEIRAAVMNLADMDQSKPQQTHTGRVEFAHGGRRLELRCEYTPTIGAGGQIVSRILDPAKVSKSLEDLGFITPVVDLLTEQAAWSQGMIVLNGPTGSGKTSTIYATLRAAIDTTRKVITVENPVEYRLPGAQQIQVTSRGNVKQITFDNILRSIMRMDPDVIMVGEIRDDESAKAALEAAITGHLVVSTIHTSTALGLYTRLVGMNIPGYEAADGISLSMSQRLLRRLHSCKRSRPATQADRQMLDLLGLPGQDHVAEAAPDGCTGCYGTGYADRAPVAEVVVPSDRIRSLVINGGFDETELGQAAFEPGGQVVTYGASTAPLIANGETSLEEINRQVGQRIRHGLTALARAEGADIPENLAGLPAYAS